MWPNNLAKMVVFVPFSGAYTLAWECQVEKLNGTGTYIPVKIICCEKQLAFKTTQTRGVLTHDVDEINVVCSFEIKVSEIPIRRGNSK